MTDNRNPADFPKTRWSLIRDSQNPQALGTLCQLYWLPIYTYARRLRSVPEDAEDLTQAFFEQLLSKDGFGIAEKSRGKLRNFLLKSFQNFANSEWKSGQCQKRGGKVQKISLDGLGQTERQTCEPRVNETPEVQFNRAWAGKLLDDTLQKLEAAYADAGKGEIFQALQYLFIPSGDQKPYREVAKELGVSEASIRFSAFKLRSRYRDFLRETISDTVSSRDEVEEELRHLRSVFDLLD